MPKPQSISAVIVADQALWEPASADHPVKNGRHEMIARLMDILGPHVDELIIVTADPMAFLAHDGLIVRLHPDKPGPLGAVYAGMFAARHQQALVVHCGLPVVDASMITRLCEAAEPRFDAVAPSAGIGLFPAVYHKRCLKILANLWFKGPAPPTVEMFFRQVRLRTLEAE